MAFTVTVENPKTIPTEIERLKQTKNLAMIIGVEPLEWAKPYCEREGGKQVLKRVKQSQQNVSRLTTIWVDGGFDGESFMQWVMNFCRWIIQVVLRPEETKGEVLLKKRWVVERTFGWFMGCRRLVRDYELLPETSETFIYLAMIRIMVRRLA